MMLRPTPYQIFCLPLIALGLAGCGVGNPYVGASISDPASNAFLSGSVHGGSQPIVGATVTLYAPSLSGYGGAATSIVSTNTSSGGSFSLPRPYACPANSSNVYLLVTGGNPGSGTNSAIGLAALLGPCSGLSSGTKVDVNEATTVAAAYTLAQFSSITSSNGTAIGTSATNATGLNNAYFTANNLVNTQTGAANGATSISGMVLPAAEINTLANILAACVNANGATPTACATLFSAVTPSGGTAPTNTFQAAIDLALNPAASNVTALWGLSSANSPFQPTLSAQPNDFALAIQYNGAPIGSCGFTNGVAIDQTGNAWVGCGTGNAVNAGITEISPAGAYLTSNSGFPLAPSGALGPTGGTGIAIDANGAAWVTSAAENAVYKILSNGTVSRFASSADGFNGPAGIGMMNSTSLVYIANPAAYTSNGTTSYSGLTYTILNLDGSLAGTTNPNISFLAGPLDIVPTSQYSVWTSVAGLPQSSGGYGGDLYQWVGNDPSTPPYEATIYTGDGPPNEGTFSYGMAGDRAGDLYVVSDGTVYADNGYSGCCVAGVSTFAPAFNTNSLLFDGLNRVLVTGTQTGASAPGVLSIYAHSGTLIETITANGTLPVNAYAPTGMDVDASGNVWLTGTPASGTKVGFVTEIVGLAGPLPTPRSVAAQLNEVATRP